MPFRNENASNTFTHKNPGYLVVNQLLKYGLLLLLFRLSYAEAQQPFPLPIKRYSTEHGLSCKQTNRCIKDQRGFLWIATNDGLNRFDGAHFKAYRNIPGDSNSLIGNVVVNLGEDHAGNIWVMTTAGLCQFLVAENRFRQYHFPGLTPEKRQYTLEPGFLMDGDHVWFSDYDGVNKLHVKTKALKQYKLETPYNGRMMICIGKDARNQIYAGSIEGVFRFDTSTKVFRHWSLPDAKASGLSFMSDSRKTFWMTRWANAADAYNPETGEIIKFGGQESMRQVFELQPDSFWASGDFEGLLAFSRKDRRFQKLSFSNLETGLDENYTVTSQASFGDGFVWLCTVEGLVRISRKPEPFISITSQALGFKTPAYFIGLATEPGHPNQLWVNAWYQNLVQYNLATTKSKPIYDAKFENKLGLPWVNVYRMVLINQALWFVGHHGIYCKPPGAKKYQRLLPPGKDTSYLHNAINSFRKLENGRFMAVSVGRGLVEFSADFQYYKEYPFQFEGLADWWDMRYSSLLELDTNQYLLCSDKSGIIYFNKKEGIFKRLPQDNSGKLFPNFIQNMAREANGRIWIASMEGIVVLDKFLNRVFQFSAQNGLPASQVSQVLVDQSNRVWASTNQGLALWQPKHQTFRIFTKSDGLPDNHPERLFMLETGEFVSSHASGLAFFQPQNLVQKPVPPKVLISDVLFENKEMPFSGIKKLEIPPEVSQIQFWFSALEYGKPEGMRYAYQVEQMNKDWVDIGENHQVSFFQLPPGDYTLRVKAFSALGVSSLSPAEIKFTVLTPYYKSWWFRTLLLALLVSGIVAFYRYRIQQILKLERVRQRISRDLHDDIGSTLSSINILTRSAKRRFEEKDQSRLAENLEKIGERTQRMLENMSDIIWSVKPENDNLDRVASRMSEFASSMLEAKKIDFSIDFSNNLENYSLPLEVKNNLFLIFKEAVNNLAKYSQCSFAEIQMRVENGKLKLRIKDNGIGFDNKHNSGLVENHASNTGGNGLRNMAERASEMGALFSLETLEGKGTCISLEISL